MKPRVRTWILIGIGTVVIVLLTSPRVHNLLSLGGRPDAAGPAVDRLSVTAVVVRPEKIVDRIFSSGTVRANEEVDLRSEIAGKVTGIHFREGSRVHKGDLLLKIDDSELQAQLLKQDSERKLAQDKENRRRQLLERGNISPEDYDIALNELNAIRAEAQLIEARIRKTELRAPFEGIIGLRFVSEGSYVSPETRIASLQNITTVKIDLSVPERYARDLRPGAEISFRLSGNTTRFRGAVYAIEPKIDPTTRTVLLRARCPNPGGTIMPGGFAEVELSLKEIPDALMIPTEALIPDLQGQKVFLARNGAADQSRVETGLRTEKLIQVTSGLRAGDTVITSGILQLAPGMPIALTGVR